MSRLSLRRIPPNIVQPLETLFLHVAREEVFVYMGTEIVRRKDGIWNAIEAGTRDGWRLLALATVVTVFRGPYSELPYDVGLTFGEQQDLKNVKDIQAYNDACEADDTADHFAAGGFRGG